MKGRSAVEKLNHLIGDGAAADQLPPRPAKPPGPSADNIPAEMKARRQWVVWRYELRGGKWTKVPYQPHNPRWKAKADDSRTWSTFDAAWQAYLAGGFDGIGYEFSADDPYFGVDVDSCLNDGLLLEWAQAFVEMMEPSYGEISPSGRGLKFIARGKLPEPTGTRREGLGPDGDGALELYDHGRFFTLTGDVYGSSASVADLPDAAVTLYRIAKPERKPTSTHQADAAPQQHAATRSPSFTPTEDDVFQAIGRCRSAPKIRALWAGSWQGSYSSQSQADLALCNYLAFYCGPENHDLAARLFLQSGLGQRGKATGRKDYVERTVNEAYAGRTDFYTWEPRAAIGKPRLGVVTPDAADTPEDLEEIEIPDRWPRQRPEMFHGLAGDIVRLADPHTEADQVAVLVQFLVAFANLVGRGFHFSVGATRHYLNLFACLVGLTALGRKGSSWDVVKYVLAMIDPGWTGTRVQSGLVSGEGLIHHVRDARFEDREVTDKKTGAKTVETVQVDAGVMDKRLTVIESELARSLKAMNRDTNTLSDVIRQAWDSGSLRTMGKREPSVATDAHVSIIGHVTQADILRHLTAEDSANGFANRFLWICSRRSKLLPDGGELDSVGWSPVKDRLEKVLVFCRGSGGMTTSRPVRMARDAAARKVWRGIYGELSAGKPGLLGKIVSRAEAQVMRLACVYAILDRSEVVKAEHLLAAVALWEYSADSARLVFGAGGADTDSERLMAALRAAPDGLTRWQISQDVFKRHKTSAQIAGLLSELLTQGMAHRKTDASSGGRPAERWHAGKERAS